MYAEKNKNLEQSAKQLFVRVSDQHGHRETAPRDISAKPAAPRSDGKMVAGTTSGTWCEELEVGASL